MNLRGVLVVEDPGDAGGSRTAGIAALENVANRPFAHHVVDVLVSAGAREVIVASSTELAPCIRECLDGRDRRDDARLRFVEQPEPLDLPGAMRLVAPMVDRASCMLHVASGLLGEPLQPFLQLVRSDAPDAVLIVHQGPTPYGHLSSATREMLNVAELDPRRSALGIAGVLLFGPGGLEQAAASDWGADHDVDLTAVCRRIAAAGGTCQVRFAGTWHAYTGRALELLELNRIVLDGLESDRRHRDTNGNRIEGRVHIHEAASVRSSVIVGPAVIGAEAQVIDSYIGPYTAVGVGARIEGAEVERSIVSAGATITHIGCRLAGSVIGRDARVFRDFSLPRALRLRVGDGNEVALS